MKKIFPLIILLICLSVAGLIILQVNWFKNQLLVQQEKIIDRVEKAGVYVSEDLGKKLGDGGRSFRLNKGSSAFQGMQEMYFFNYGRMPNVSERYTTDEVRQKLKDAFKKQKLNDLRFEFAVTSNANNFWIEMQSQHFQNESLDTNHFRKVVVPVTSASTNFIDGFIPFEHLFIIIPDFQNQVWRSLNWQIIFSALFSIIIISAFFITVKTMLNQKKLSEIKSDFINNMTHEFKTPLATISLAVDAIRNEKVINDAYKLSYFSGIIKDENRRMNKHVETILQAALMDRQELKLHFKPTNIHQLIQQVVDNFKLQLQESYFQSDRQRYKILQRFSLHKNNNPQHKQIFCYTNTG